MIKVINWFTSSSLKNGTETQLDACHAGSFGINSDNLGMAAHAVNKGTTLLPPEEDMNESFA